MTAAAHLHRRIVALLLLVTACGHAGCGRSLPIEPVESRRPPANAGAAGTPIVCARGLVACEGSCIDPRSNHGHCGASDSCTGPQAGEACDALAFCVDGACADSCPADYARCDGACTNGAVDPDHCGARDDCQGLRSGDLCGDGEVCADGDCQLACPPGGLACAGRCIDPAIDRLHCGASGDCLGPDAGQACSAGQFCADGSCTAACPPGAIECDGLCVDPLNDPLHCGASGACAGDDAGSVCDGGRVCFDGTCTDGCPPQTLECDGRCIDPLTDALHCGARGACDGDDAGERCMPQAACIGGLCLQPCDVGQVRCGDACIDPQTDATFCGAGGNCMGDDAGTMCTAEQVCRQGQCASCDGGEIVCDGTCIDPRSDRDFCGAASPCVGPDVGEVCAADEACVDGRCSSECPGDLVLCDGACIDPLVDRDHCGASGACDEEDAGSACAQGELCDLGSCVLDCPAGLLDCDGTCVQPEADPLHCGASGDCMGDAAGEVCADDQLCSAGVCVDSCPAGQSACVGGCVDPRTDRNNCGSCRQRCAPQESCVDGSCQCPAGLSACQQACLDLQTDVANCGACGNACAPGKRCQGGTCVCLAGFTDCGDHCANLLVDEQDCGGCGQACRLFETCGGGSCLCGAGFTRCDRGCTDTGRDARNCGGCGIACDDGQRCSGGQCLCEPGFIPCGGTCVDPRHDADHCGGCGNACAADLSCLDGGCGCGPGHAVCGGVCRDLFDDRNHCGGCDNACAADEACAGGSCRCLLHVDAEGGSDQADGTSWATALRTLQHALAVNGERGCAIWLTGGTHRPTDGDDRMATFELLGAVAIYGGFVGTEADPSERVDGAPPTVLSGDLGVRGQNFDNSYHVVHCDPVDGCRDSSVLDTLTIEGGNATGMGLEQRGGGLYCRDAMPTLRDLTFRDNEAIFGGGIYSIWGEMRAADCTFEDNRAVDGGAVYMLRADAQMTRLRFLNNRSQARGGGVTQAARAGLTVTDCAFVGNRSQRGGGIYGVVTGGEPVTVQGSAFVDNSAALEGGGIYCGDDWVLGDSLLLENRATHGGGVHGWPQVVGTRFERNVSSQEGGAMRIVGGEGATLAQCVWVDNSAEHGGALLVAGGGATIDNGLLTGNSAERGGAIATRDGTNPAPWVVVSDSTVENNTAVRGGGVHAGIGTGLSLINSLIAGNTAQADGGGVFAERAAVETAACVLRDNSAALRGGGLFADGAHVETVNTVVWRNFADEGAGLCIDGGSVELLASTVAHNEAASSGGGVAADLSSAIVISGSILWGNVAAGQASSAAQYAGEGSAHVVHSDVQGGCPLMSCTDDATGNLAADPEFVDADAGDLRLQPSSACIDAGDNAALDGVATDLDGNPRIADGPDPDPIATVDMGALEYTP